MSKHLPAVSSDKPLPPKRISKRVKAAIASMVTGDTKSVTAAAESVGLSREHLSRELSRPHIAEYLNQKVQRHLAMASARAGAVKVGLLDSENAMVADRSSSFILSLVGIQPATQPGVNVNLNLRAAGFIIDLSEPGDEKPMKVISP